MNNQNNNKEQLSSLNVNEQLLDAIEVIVQQALANTSFDRTRIARIVSIKANNTYVVELDGEQYEIKSNFIFYVNETVNVLIKQNNIMNLYLLPKR